MAIDRQPAETIAYGSAMEIWVLGPTVLHREGMELSPGGLKQRTVFALLAAGGERGVSVDQPTSTWRPLA